MLLRIDPVHSPLWVSPTRLRFGIDRPIVVLDGVGRPEELLVTALQHGARQEALVVIGEQVGRDEAAVDELIARLGPVLLPATPRPAALRIALERTEVWPAEDADLARLVGDAVIRAGASVVDRDDDVDAAVVLAPFAVPPRTGAYWLNRDIPLLPVVPGALSVEVGPLVIGDRTACLHCIELHRQDLDPDRVTLTAQLTATRRATSLKVAPTTALASAAVVASILFPLARDLVEETAGADAAWMSIVSADGSITRAAWPPHPRCSCRDPRGNAIAVVRSIDEARGGPRRSAGPRALA